MLPNTVTRKDSITAGMEFVTFLNRKANLHDIERSFGALNEVQLRDFNNLPKSLAKVFTNPAMPYEEIERRFLQREGKSPEDNLRMAFHGLPLYVIDWFSLGQATMMVLSQSKTVDDMTFMMLLSVMQLKMRPVEIGPENCDQIIDLFERHRIGVHRNEIEWFSKLQQRLLALADDADRKELNMSEGTSGHLTGKLLTLTVLLGFGLIGFFLFRDRLSIAILWLVFFVLAIPPTLAFLFESKKLTGANLVDLYKIGISGIPFVGHLFRS